MKSRLLDGGIALAFALAAFLIRTLPGAGAVLQDHGVHFVQTDPLYHMRVADLLVERFPRPVRHDALLLWPQGQDLTSGPLFDYLIAMPAIILGGGHPSRGLLDLCGAFLPPVLGGLLVAAFWLLGRKPLGRAGAALAAALAAVMPGQLLKRTALGYTDHHAVALLSLGLFRLFLVRTASERDEARSRREATAAGAALALLVLSWPWGTAFGAVAALWSVLDGTLRQGSRALARVARATAVAAGPVAIGAFVFPVLRKPAAALVLIALATAAGARTKDRKRLLISFALLAVAGLAAAVVVFPELPRELFFRLRPDPTRMTVGEAAPLLSTGPGFAPALSELSTGFFAAVYGAVIAVRSLRSRPEGGLLLVFLAITVLLALAQTRFSGEAAIVAAMLGGLVPRHLLTVPENIPRARENADPSLSLASRRRARRRERRRKRVAAPRARKSLGMAGRILVLSGLALLLVVPAALVAPDAIRKLPLEDPAWESAMSWLRANSPDPFSPAAPDGSARYSVLSWWDNGYLIARQGGRVPVTNPTQENAAWAARALLVDEEHAAHSLLASRAVKYVALDFAVPLIPGPAGFRGQFPALAVWAGIDAGRYFAKIQTPETGPSPRSVFFAGYYRTLAYRLWRYGGAAVTPVGPVLAVRLPSAAGAAAVRKFSSWAEADRFVRNAGASWRVASGDPLSTCVPLEAWPGFHRVYSSPTDALRSAVERVARVEIFARNP